MCEEETKKAPVGAQSETLLVNGQKVTTYTINGKTVTQTEFEAAAEKKRRDLEELAPVPRKEAPDVSELKKRIEALSAGKTDTGQTTYRLININRSDPDPSLFAVPAGYTIKDESQRPPKKRRSPEEEGR